MRNINPIEKVHLLWEWQCKYDGIDPRESFAAFSTDNPYQSGYNQAYKEMMKEENDAMNYGYNQVHPNAVKI